MQRFQTLNHTKWDCKYHIVFIPKYRRKVIYGELRKYLDNYPGTVLLSWHLRDGAVIFSRLNNRTAQKMPR